MSVLSDDQNVRNLKDFLLLYNKLTEQCFNRCVSSMNQRSTSKEENNCVTVCADRFVGFNQRLMFVFMEHQNLKQQAAMKEAKKHAESAEIDVSPNQIPDSTNPLLNKTVVDSAGQPSV